MDKFTPGPWSVDGPPSNQIVWSGPENRVCFLAHSDGANDEMDIANGRLIAAAPDLLNTAKNAAATIGAIYQWLERVEEAGGATSISGIAACNAMLKSLRKNAERTEALVMAPLRAAITKATT